MLRHRRHIARKKRKMVDQQKIVEKYCGTWRIWKEEVVIKSKNTFKKSSLHSAEKSKLKSTVTLEVDGENENNESSTGSLVGTIFILEEDKQVTWKVPQGVDVLPLFESKSFFVSRSSDRDQIDFALPYRGSMRLYSTVADDQLVLTHGKVELHCRRVANQNESADRHSLADALETSPIHDLEIISRTGKKFNVHKCMLHAVFPELPVDQFGALFSGLQDHLHEIVWNFVYSGLLSDETSLEHLMELKSFCVQHIGLNVLINAIKKSVERRSVKARILALLTDCQTRLMRIASSINDSNQLSNEIDESHLSNPTRLMSVLKESCCELLPGIVMQLEMMYLYSVESKRMTKKEKSALIKQITQKNSILIKNELKTSPASKALRAVEVNFALQAILNVLYKHLDLLTHEELKEICKQGQPTVIKFIEKANLMFDESCKPLLNGMVIRTNEKFKKEKIKKSASKVLWVLRTALHAKELSKLREVENVIKHAMVYLNQKREEFSDMDCEVQTEFLSELIEDDLPIYIRNLDNMKFFEHPTRSHFLYIFSNISSYMKWFLDIFVDNMDEMQALLTKLKAFINTEDFEKTLNDLLQLPNKLKKKHDEEKQGELYKNPVPVESILPQCISRLYTTLNYTDLEFLIRDKESVVSVDTSMLNKSYQHQGGERLVPNINTVSVDITPTNENSSSKDTIEQVQISKNFDSKCSIITGNSDYELVDGYVPCAKHQSPSKCNVSSINETSDATGGCEAVRIKELPSESEYLGVCHAPRKTTEGYEIIRAHSVVVCSRCAWFKRALSSGMKEARERKFYIEDTSPSLFSIFIKYLYTFIADFENVNTGDMMELMSIGDRYENYEFKTACQNELQQKHICMESAIYILAFAHNLGASDLKAAVLTHIASFPQCCLSEDYGKLTKDLKDEVEAKIKIFGKKEKSGIGDEILPFNEKTEEEEVRFLTLSGSSSTSSSSSIVDIEPISSPELSPCVDSRYNNSSDLNECIQILREIIDVSDDELIRLALAADNDSQRALNYYFQNNP